MLILEKIKLNLSPAYITKIIEFDLSPRFVEFCLSEGIEDIQEMSDLRDQYIEGGNLSLLIRQKKGKY